MAYVSKELVQRVRQEIKPILAKYGAKATVSGTNKSTLTVNISTAAFNPMYDADQEGNSYVRINPYQYKSHFDGKTLEFLNELMPILNKGNWDRSDIMTDYFDVGWYIDVSFGNWQKPFILK
jgi:hypothetical protein